MVSSNESYVVSRSFAIIVMGISYSLSGITVPVTAASTSYAEDEMFVYS